MFTAGNVSQATFPPQADMGTDTDTVVMRMAVITLTVITNINLDQTF